MFKEFAVTLLVFVMIHAVPLSAQEMNPIKAGVVKIEAQTFEGMRRTGTGFIVQLTRDAAYIITASHVVEGDNQPQVEFFTRRNRPISATVLGLEGGDPRGLAVLLVSGEDNLPFGLSALYLATSVLLEGGDEVMALGFPGQAGPWSVTKGNFVSRKEGDFVFDAAIDEGNSGGPMIKEGQVVGLITGLSGRFGRATPAASVQFFLEGYGIVTGQKLLQKGIAAYNEKRYKTAIDDLEKVTKEMLPKNLKIEAYQYLAFCYIEDEPIGQAKSSFQKLLAIKGDYRLGDEFPKRYREILDQVIEKPIPRVISVKSVPSGASVYFDGQLQPDKTPMRIKNVDTEQHALKILLEGYEDWTSEISKLSWEKAGVVQGKSTLEITATLLSPTRMQLEKKTGAIFVKSEPSSAQVKLDDVLQRERTPMTIREVTAGLHRLKLTLNDYRDWEQKINVEAGTTARINAKLIKVLPYQSEPEPIPSVKKGSNLKWYLIGGTAVTGGVVAALLWLSREKSTSLGISITFPEPGQ